MTDEIEYAPPRFEDLPPEEQGFLRDLMRLQDAASRAVDEEILPVSKWLESEYHTGTFGKVLYPFWHVEMEELFGEGTTLNYDELVITGSLSTGKSFFAVGVWLRLCYIFSHFKSLPQLFGLYEGSRIFMAYLSVSSTEAELTGFGEFRNMVDRIPFFKDRYPRNKAKNSVLEFPNGLHVLYGSDVLHFIGQNLFSLIFDEANFVRKGGGNPGDISKAMDIYKSSRLRIRTRMARSTSPMSGLNILVSSVTHQSSATEKIIEGSKGDASTRVIATKVYEAQPAGTYSEEKFMFFVGNDLTTPKVIQSRDDFTGLVPENERVLMPPGEFTDLNAIIPYVPPELMARIELVPVNFLKDCLQIPEQSLMDIIGHSVAAQHTFFRDLASWNACIELGETLGLRHPFSQESVAISVKGDEELMDYLDVNFLKSIVRDNPLFIAIDQSVSGDATGLGLSFPLKLPEDAGTIVVVAGLLRIVPPRWE